MISSVLEDLLKLSGDALDFFYVVGLQSETEVINDLSIGNDTFSEWGNGFAQSLDISLLYMGKNGELLFRAQDRWIQLDFSLVTFAEDHDGLEDNNCIFRRVGHRYGKRLMLDQLHILQSSCKNDGISLTRDRRAVLIFD